MQHNLLLSGDFYTKVNNEHVVENEPDDGVVHLKSNEPYIYSLPAASAKGEEFKVEFGASRELREGAYLELRIEPFRGVVSWEEIAPDDVPAAAAACLE